MTDDVHRSARDEILKRVQDLEMRVDFPEVVIAEARQASANPGIDDDTLVDLTALPFVTIDYVSSRDLDQALFIEEADTGFAVYYALADAAHFVPPGSAMWEEAMARGASFYLPGLTVPMLPRALCEGVTSLNPGEDRRALTFRMSLDNQGRVRETDIFRARIHSRAKLSYDGVQEFYDSPDGSALSGQEFTRSLELLQAVGELRIRRAEERNVVNYDRVAIGLDLSSDGQSVVMRGERRNSVQRYNEQLSLLSNIEGARYLSSRVDRDTGLHGVFKIHPHPEEIRVEELSKFVIDLAAALELDEEVWVWHRDQKSLAEYIDGLPDEGPGSRLTRAVQRQAMVMGQRSYFATEPGPHHGIGAEAYSRFSAPMRELVGILTSHLALAQLDGVGVSDVGLSRAVVDQVVEVANQASALQKRATKLANELALSQLLAGDLELEASERPRRPATVMGLTPTKIYLQLDEPPVDVKIYCRDLEQFYGPFALERHGFELVASGGGGKRFRLGDEVVIYTDRYQRKRRRWLFRGA